jgi:hypothetical protein
MEIDISRLFMGDFAPMDYSASAAELGQDAGRITWAHAMEDAEGFSILNTPDKLDAFRAHVKGFGSWSDEEIAGWTQQECNALFLQMVAGDIREAGLDVEAPNWADYEANESIAGRMYPGDDERIYYYLGD